MQKSFCENEKIEKCLARKEFCVCDVTLCHPLFRGVPRDEVHKLNSFSHIVRYLEQEIVFHRGKDQDSMYFVLRGKVRLYSEDLDSSKEYIHRICDEGAALNAETLLSTKIETRYAAQCLEDSVLFVINKTSLKAFIQEHPMVLSNLAIFLSDAIIELEERSKSFVLEEVSERLVHFLNQEFEKTGASEIQLDLPKAELAHYLGTIPSTLSKVFAKLEAEGKILVSRNAITKTPGWRTLSSVGECL